MQILKQGRGRRSSGERGMVLLLVMVLSALMIGIIAAAFKISARGEKLSIGLQQADAHRRMLRSVGPTWCSNLAMYAMQVTDWSAASGGATDFLQLDPSLVTWADDGTLTDELRGAPISAAGTDIDSVDGKFGTPQGPDATITLDAEWTILADIDMSASVSPPGFAGMLVKMDEFSNREVLSFGSGGNGSRLPVFTCTLRLIRNLNTTREVDRTMISTFMIQENLIRQLVNTTRKKKP